MPQDVATVQDTKWNSAWGTYGDLYFPHIYEPNQSLTDPSGMNPYGRWDLWPLGSAQHLSSGRGSGA